MKKIKKYWYEGYMTVTKDIKPVLKWGGGKRQLVPNIREYYQDLKPKKYSVVQ